MRRDGPGGCMGFDVHLMAFRDGKNASADAVASRMVLERVRYDHSPDMHAYDIDFDDGSHVELYSGGLDGNADAFGGGMFVMRGITSAITDFIFEFAHAAGCVILPAMEPACVLLPREGMAEHLPADM